MKRRQQHGKSEAKAEARREDSNNVTSPSCPLCGRGFDRPLLLPCAHVLCGRCLTEGARLDRHRPLARAAWSPSLPVCAVLCPHCARGVELPCFDWSSAADSLPVDLTLTFDPRLGASARQVEEGEKREDEDEVGLGKKQTVVISDSVDLSEEEMEQSVSGLVFVLDSSSADPPLHLTSSALTVTFGPRSNPGDPAGSRDPCAPLPQVCGDVTIRRGQYYWEVDVCNSALYSIGVISLARDQGWWFERHGLTFHTVFDGRRELLPSVPPQLKSVGVFLNVGGSCLTFHNPLTQELLAAVPSRFTLPLRPALQLGQGRLKLRPGLPPPPHVFFSCGSAYRGPEGAGSGRWKRDVTFGSVRVVIQKFEEMAASDSDSGLMSSCSSSSTLASLTEANAQTAPPAGRED